MLKGMQIMGLDAEIVFYTIVAVAFIFFVVDVLLWFKQREVYRWYPDLPYEPEAYLLAPILSDFRGVYLDSLAAALYNLILKGYVSVIFAEEKAIMGTMKKIKIKKVKKPTEEILSYVYEFIPDSVEKTGLFGDNTSDDWLDIDDVHTHMAQNITEDKVAEYRSLVDKVYVEKYGVPRKDVKFLGIVFAVLSFVWAGAAAYVGFVISGKGPTLSYLLYAVSVLLLLSGILSLTVKFLWQGVSKTFRSRWLGFKQSVYKGDVEIRDFYSLIGYSMALGIIDHYFQTVKNLIVDGKVKVGKPEFLDTEKVTLNDIKSLAMTIYTLAGAVGGADSGD